MDIARVIVDVPASVVNQTFDYRIPEAFASLIQPGMRVIIPFGPRKISGFVMELIAQSDYDKVKDIIDVLDLTPVLTEELLHVGKWLAEDTVSLYITTYQAMLPQVLKAKYDKELVRISDAPLHPELAPLFAEESSVAYDRVLESVSAVAVLKDAIEAGQLKINYLVKSQARKQYETIIHPAKQERLQEALREVRAQATRQRQILNFFIERNEPINQSVL